MFLAFQLSDIVTVPFGWLMAALYHFTDNYGVAMILFGILVQLILMPINAKSKKSMMKMSRLTPRIQDIQNRYAGDPQKQNELMQKLYQEEGVSMGGGCLWSFIPMLILFPLFAVIRQPITYILMESEEVAMQIVREEGVSMGGGCLWSFIPMLILFPLFAVIRQPITYILMESEEVAMQIVSVIRNAAPELFSGNNYYDQVIAAQAIPQFAEELKAAIPGISELALAGINFNFLGVNLGTIPQFNIFSPSWVWDWAHIGAFLIPVVSAGSQVLQMWISQKTNDNLGTIPQFNIFSPSWVWDWAHIGAFLIPVVSAGSQVLQMWISQKTNDSVITDENGVQDKETAKKSQQNQSMQIMMWMMPLMSLWIGFTVSAGLSLYWFIGGVTRMISDPIMTKHYRNMQIMMWMMPLMSLWIGFTVSAGLSLYWFIGGVTRMISDPIMTKHYRKIYDAEDAIRLQKAMEQERLEAEKERIRAERRAANPDGITTNTSKKKLQKQQRDQEQAAKAAAAKELEAEKERIRAERRAANPDGITTNTSKKKLQKQQRDQEQAAKAAAAKEYASKKGIVLEEEAEEQCMSGIPSRPYCKGRNYSPNRYGAHATEE